MVMRALKFRLIILFETSILPYRIYLRIMTHIQLVGTLDYQL